MRMFRFALCVMTAVVAAPALGNNIVTNGSFANPPTGSFIALSASASQNGDSAISDWGIDGSTGAGVSTGGPPALGSTQFGFVDGGTTIYQDLGALSPNTIYQLNLYSQQTGVTNRQGGTLTESLAIGPAGQQNSDVVTSGLTIANSDTVTPVLTFAPLSPVTFTTGSSVSGDLYVLLTGGGTAPGGSTQLYVDDVMVSANQVPEPSTTAFVGISALSMLGYRLVRRRRKS